MRPQAKPKCDSIATVLGSVEFDGRGEPMLDLGSVSQGTRHTRLRMEPVSNQ
jgi:hypothetical protein